MTIKEASAKYNVSRQAIYQRLKRQGLQVDTIRDPATGELTPDGEKAIEALFTSTQSTEASTDSTRIDALTEQLTCLQAQAEALTKQVDTLTAQLAAMTEERDFLRRALDQAQALHAMTLQALPPPRGTVSLAGRIKRIFSK